jgi:hypothetical protein
MRSSPFKGCCAAYIGSYVTDGSEQPVGTFLTLEDGTRKVVSKRLQLATDICCISSLKSETLIVSVCIKQQIHLNADN